MSIFTDAIFSIDRNKRIKSRPYCLNLENQILYFFSKLITSSVMTQWIKTVLLGILLWKYMLVNSTWQTCTLWQTIGAARNFGEIVIMAQSLMRWLTHLKWKSNWRCDEIARGLEMPNTNSPATWGASRERSRWNLAENDIFVFAHLQ